MFNIIKSSPILWVLIFLAIVAPSFFVGAMKVVFFIVIGIIILLFILGLVFRAKIKNMQKRMEEQMRDGGHGTYQDHTTQEKEGDVKIYDTPNTKKKRVRDDVGEYIDFEEIKD